MARSPPAGRAERAGVAAVVLAAGRSRRFRGGPKLLAPVAGAPLWWSALAAACGSRARPVVVVLGARPVAMRRSLAAFRCRLPRPVALRVVVNRASARGMAGSLQAGLRQVPDRCAGALVLLADMPEVSAALLDALAAAFAPGDAAVVPVRQGRRGNPVLLARAVFGDVMGLRGDQGARGVLKRSQRVRELAVADRAVARDIDTRRDHLRWRRGRRH